MGDRIKLAVRITDVGGGIGPKVIWRVDGRTKGETTAPGLAGPPSPGRYCRHGADAACRPWQQE